MRDYYEILGVARDADADAIKKAYRKLALQYHPDRNQGSEQAAERFKEATEAYEILRDPQKRAAYDRYGHAGVKGAAAGAGFGGFDFADALDVFMRDFGFEDLFGGTRAGGRGGRGARARARGSDVRIGVPLTLKEVALGSRKTVKVPVLDRCGVCMGSGAAEGATPTACPTCGGAGEVRRVQRSFLGQLVTVTPCPSCGGEGQRIEEPCDNCDGRGVEPAEQTTEVEIPPGVSSGDYLTVRGKGNAAARGGERGDLIVVLEVQDDQRFVRDGADLIHELRITFSQAALGAETDVPTVMGTARLKIPAGIQSGKLIRMRGRGLPHLHGGGRGDQIVRINVWTPTELSPEEESLLRELAKHESEPPAMSEADRDGGFWSKVREVFTG